MFTHELYPFDGISTAPQQSAYLGPKTRILVAEDHPINQKVFHALLALFGGKALVVDNGAQAVMAWEMCEWDIVLLDIQMPELDGVDAARMIRAKELETGRARTPMLAVTANSSPLDAVRYCAAGMDGLVAKPIVFNDLMFMMESVLAARPANDTLLAEPACHPGYAAGDAKILAEYIASEMSRLRLDGFIDHRTGAA